MKIFINGEYRNLTPNEEKELEQIQNEIKEFDENKVCYTEKI